MKKITFLLLLVVIFQSALSDVYLHTPRGSNNRWDESGRGRNNANRLFDSQNNERGGYNVGNVYYHVGSKLMVEWTNQHSCGDQNNHCDIILQYMCENFVRDGTTTSTIPSNPVQCNGNDCNEDRSYGMHEDFYYYVHCKLRSRNIGLFTADQNVGPSATQTRQNPRGTRFGYECPEERDYYPYWGPTPWKDIAILTNNISRCSMYQRESQNVKSKFACKVGTTYLYQNSQNNPQEKIPIEKEECEAFRYKENEEEKRGVWMEYNSHGMEAPACFASQASRDNHLGDGLGGNNLNFNWTIPNDISEHCVFRIRYNISTSDYDRDNTTSEENNRKQRNQNREDNPGVDLWTRQGLTLEQGIQRGYILENNPEVNIFNNSKLNLQLAVNTAQYGRTFEDRSHTFGIRARPEDISPLETIYNVGVRGKRGNIVQVYPSVEYDFTPNTLIISADSLVHFQWTGSDNNNRNNDGQGRAGTDRSNVLLLANASYIEGEPETRPKTYGQLGSSYPSSVMDSQFAGFDFDTRKSLAILLPHIGGDMTELNSAGTYFDLRPRKVTLPGVYNYMCTRNNNFSNRSQKGRFIVLVSAFFQQLVDQNGAVLIVHKPNTDEVTAKVEIEPNAFSSPISVELWNYVPDEAPFNIPPPNTNYISNRILLKPVETSVHTSQPMTLEFRLNENVGPLYIINIYRSDRNTANWELVDVLKHEDGKVKLQTARGGYFVATKQINPVVLAGVVIGSIFGFIILVVLCYYCFKKKLSMKGYGGKF